MTEGVGVGPVLPEVYNCYSIVCYGLVYGIWYILCDSIYYALLYSEYKHSLESAEGLNIRVCILCLVLIFH